MRYLARGSISVPIILFVLKVASLIVLIEVQSLMATPPIANRINFANSTKDQQQQIATNSETVITSNSTTTNTTTIKAPSNSPLHQEKQHDYDATKSTSNDCNQPCTNVEFANILNKISLNVDILRDFQRNEALGQQHNTNSTNKAASTSSIRPECIKKLIQMIKKLASSELEMKTLLEFASSAAHINLRSDLSYLRTSYAQDRQVTSDQENTNKAETSSCAASTSNGGLAVEYLLGDEPSPSASESDSKAQFLPKLVASVDQWLDTIERFTLTREWGALMRVFKGLESILGMFSTKVTGSDKVSSAQQKHQATGNKSNALVGDQTNKTTARIVTTVINQNSAGDDTTAALVATLERELPIQVQTLTGSLNQLFPWHVWPWNNIDLYSTVDTFMNHGIFAFSKTTAGPERRIDYLPQMLDSLFKSLRWDSFPKKCNDWSRMICDLELFYDRLAVAPLQDSSMTNSAEEVKQRKEHVRKLISIPENKLTQELVCIMFSSLSMQQFGGKDIDFNMFQEGSGEGGPKMGPTNQLRWDRQVRKALKLYKLSREALTDNQWMAFQKQFNQLWSEMKISDRVIMVGRIIQLLTNCHMPREILESALWKDIYKYKNAMNQIGDIVIEELNRSSENGQFTISQLAIGSKHLEDILTRFIRLLPRLLESLSKTITNEFPELVDKFFDEKIAFFKGPCKGHSFGELVPSLNSYHAEIAELEKLVCEQMSIKPSITMLQINNFTNEFLAMALNFTNFGGSFQSLPRLWSNNNQQQVITTSKESSQASSVTRQLSQQTAGGQKEIAIPSSNIKEQLTAAAQNGTFSIIDELAANPRLAQIVAILQSSALDPPEVHAELPELDWVEAGTSVALFYESIQRLMSYEGLFVVFPEVQDFQDEMRTKLESCKQMFTKFGKRDPIHLVSYSMDTVMPVALRTFQPLDSFHSECLSTFRDIFGETDFGNQQLVSRESRQWQCAISATNFASLALNDLIKTFNSMMRNILAQMSRQRDLFKFKQQQQLQQMPVMALTKIQTDQNSTASNNNLTTCVLFDGSVNTLMDNLPQLVDLVLETILIASTNVNQRQTLKETLCSFENTLDPLADGQFLQKRLKLREAVCHLLHESSLTACADVLRVDQWTSTMHRLNVTWFEMNAVSVDPSFRGILWGVHEFLDLFGKFKPSSMSDGLLARVLNFNSYWTGLVNKAMNSFEKYKERRFQVGLQILTPIIYESLPCFQQQDQQQQSKMRHALKVATFNAKSIQLYLSKSESSSQQQQQNSTPSEDQTARQQELIETQLRALFDWADRHLIAVSESLMRTVAVNITKLELLINRSHGSPNEAWRQFCSSPVDTYLEFATVEVDTNKASLPSQARLVEMNQAREFLCNFEWAKMEERLMLVNTYNVTTNTNATLLLSGNYTASVATPLNHCSMKQLVRVALTKWGQVIDLIVGSFASIGSGETGAPKMTQRYPKFLTLSYWQPLQAKLPTICPSQYDPTNFIWVWQALERLINSIDLAQQQANQNNTANASAQAAANSSGSNTIPTFQTTGATSESLIRIFDQLNCALDTVKGGITWDNMVNIYQDRQDVLAAHSTLNNGIALASAGANTFLAHKKFQKFLNNFVKPRMGLTAFCEMRDKSRLESIFSLSAAGSVNSDGVYKQETDREELSSALESFQEFICDTNLETLVQNINPISVCYQSGAGAMASTPNGTNQNITHAVTTTLTGGDEFPLAQTVDRFFKLASLAILDAKLVNTNDARPPIFDKNKWDQLRRWWLNQTEVHQGNSGLALTLVRVFQTLDSINSEHVVWRAIFRSFHELSEVSAYLLRAAEMELQATAEQRERGKPTKLALIKEAAEQMESVIKFNQQDNSSSTQTSGGSQKLGRSRHQHQQLASTVANVMFPEVSNFITLRTFKQLRYIKSISDYFVISPKAQELICSNISRASRPPKTSAVLDTTGNSASEAEQLFAWDNGANSSKFQLIGYKLNSTKMLNALLCHYQPSQWLTTLNIVLSSKTNSLTKKVNYMTKYLSLFTKNFEHNENLQSFIHGQQMENIEAVANKTVSYMIALSQPFRTLTISKISNISWHSIPNLLDSIDKHLCASKYEQQQQHANTSSQTQQQNYQLAVYEPKKPDIEVIICKLPSWNITQVYNYLSENIDLQSMISLATQNNHTTKLFGIAPASVYRASPSEDLGKNNSDHHHHHQKQPPTCITPLMFASKWLKIAQDLIDELMSKASKEKIRKCLSSNKKNNSAYLQTMRYVKILNSLLDTINDLTRNNSWALVRKTWTSISYAILNQSGSMPLTAAATTTAAPL